MAIPMLNVQTPRYMRRTEDLLAQQAMGQGTSASEAEAQRRSDQALSQALGMARSGRGNQALQMRNAIDSNQQAAAQIQGAAMQARAQEQQQAIARLMAQQQAQQQQNNLLSGGFLQTLGSSLGQLGREDAGVAEYAGALAPLGMMLLSDERTKTDVAEGGEDVRALLDGLNAKRFRYKGEKVERVGVMAQDVERSSSLGRALVRDVAGRKMIDVPQATGAALAGLADLNARVRQLEGGG